MRQFDSLFFMGCCIEISESQTLNCVIICLVKRVEIVNIGLAVRNKSFFYFYFYFFIIIIFLNGNDNMLCFIIIIIFFGCDHTNTNE